MEDAAWGTVITSTLDVTHNPGYGWRWNGTSTNRPSPDVYQSNHVYNFYFVGRGAAEVLTYTDSYYSDNVGTLTFQLYEITQDPQDPFTNGLVAYYPFNGNANDASGNGHNGIVENATPAVDRFGRTNACFQFNNSWVFVPYSPTLYPTNQTISLWFKNTGVYYDTALMRAGNVFDDNFRGYGINTMDFNSTFGVWNGNGINWDTVTYLKTPVGQWPLNRWVQLVFSRVGNSAVLYLDGKVVNSGTNLPSYVPVQFSPLYIGSGEAPGKNGADTLPTDVPGSFWNGFIDDVRIYNRALSSAEVQHLYQAETGGHTDIAKAVRLDFTQLLTGWNYQVQFSHDLTNWTNSGSAFTATSSTNSQYMDVTDWNTFWRLKVAP